jgi:uncharacterized protein YqcC (DUF446 family)
LRSPLSFCPQQWIEHPVEDTYMLGVASPSPLSIDTTSLKSHVIAIFIPRM